MTEAEHLDPDDDSLDEAKDLAIALNHQMIGKQYDVILNALSLVSSTVLRQATEDEEPRALDAAFAGLLVNTHAGIADDDAASSTTLVGDAPAAMTPAQMHAATALCPMLGVLMSGLLAHYEAKNVVNAWFSVLLNVLLDGGVEAAQRLLRETADGLPLTATRLQAMRDMEAGANTGQVGRA